MNIYGNNKIANRIRKFLVTHDDSINAGTTAEGYVTYVREDNRITFIDPRNGKIVSIANCE